VLPLSPYTRADIAEILRRETGSWPLEIRRLLAVAGRLNPALALKRAEEYFGIAKRLGAGHGPSESHLLGVMRDHWGVDGLGLLPADYECLGNPGPSTSTRTATGTTDFLERLGLVRRSANELVVTERGRAALEARSK
jgi:hypothetical protein